MDSYTRRVHIVAAAVLAVGIIVCIAITINSIGGTQKDMNCKNLVCVFKYLGKLKHVTVTFRAHDLIHYEKNAIGTNRTG